MILVTGATGTIGRELARQLLEAGQKVRAISRDPGKARAALSSDVEVVQADLGDPASLGPAFEGVDKLFLLSTGPTMVELESNAIEAAKAVGVKHVVKLSAMGAEIEPGMTIGRWHREVERKLESSGLGWTVLRPTFYSSNTLMAVETIKAQGTIYTPTGDGKQVPIDPRDVAAVAARALTTEGHEGKAYQLTGPEPLSVAEQAAILGEVLGKEIKHVDVPAEAAKKSMMDMGMPEAMVDALLELYGTVKAGYAGQPTDDFEKVMGRKPRSYADWARDNAAVFQ